MDIQKPLFKSLHFAFQAIIVELSLPSTIIASVYSFSFISFIICFFPAYFYKQKFHLYMDDFSKYL